MHLKVNYFTRCNLTSTEEELLTPHFKLYDLRTLSCMLIITIQQFLEVSQVEYLAKRMLLANEGSFSRDILVQNTSCPLILEYSVRLEFQFFILVIFLVFYCECNIRFQHSLRSI